MKLAVIIPCYNERDNIPLIVKRMSKTFAGRENVEVIFVDNGSSDGSEVVFAAQLAKQSFMRCVKVEQNQGYGHGILYGIEKVHDAEVYAWTHADMQCDPNDVLTAFDALCAHGIETNIVKGKRGRRPFIDTAFTYLMQICVKLVLNVKLDDVNAQPKVFSKAFYNNYIRDLAPNDFSLDLFLLCQASRAGFNTLEVPVIFAHRLHGEAKGGGSWHTRIKLIKRTVEYIIKLRATIKDQTNI
jgi:glycosyltransferase involved in cell wall biosynthesis